MRFGYSEQSGAEQSGTDRPDVSERRGSEVKCRSSVRARALHAALLNPATYQTDRQKEAMTGR